MSPCAKFSSFRIPYTIEYPSAMSAYTLPCVTPETSSVTKRFQFIGEGAVGEPAAPVLPLLQGDVLAVLDLEDVERRTRDVALPREGDGRAEERVLEIDLRELRADG